MTAIMAEGWMPAVDGMPITYRNVPKLPRVHVWPKHLIKGTVTMIAGEGGCGKGLTGVHAVAVVTTGALFPGEAADTARDRTPQAVIGVWPEDDPNEDLAWRWDAALAGAGANKDLIYDMTEDEDGEPFSLNDGGTESIAKVRGVIEKLSKCDGQVPECGCGDMHAIPQYPVGGLVIDPLLAVADTVNTNKQARKTMRQLMRMVKETGIWCLIIHHTVKDGKVAGSKGLTDVLRLVFTARHDPLNDAVIVLSVEKSNNLGRIGDLRYEITGTEQEPYLEWKASNPASGTGQPWRNKQPGKPAKTSQPKIGQVTQTGPGTASVTVKMPSRGKPPSWRGGQPGSSQHGHGAPVGSKAKENRSAGYTGPGFLSGRKEP